MNFLTQLLYYFDIKFCRHTSSVSWFTSRIELYDCDIVDTSEVISTYSDCNSIQRVISYAQPLIQAILYLLNFCIFTIYRWIDLLLWQNFLIHALVWTVYSKYQKLYMCKFCHSLLIVMVGVVYIKLAYMVTLKAASCKTYNIISYKKKN